MSEYKYMSVKEFLDSGLLFKVNREVLHPLGLALEVTENDDGSAFLSGIWDYRDDPDQAGIVYTPDHFWQCKRKLRKYMAENGRILDRRLVKFGFIKQTETPFKEGDTLVCYPEYPDLPPRLRILGMAENKLGLFEYIVDKLDHENTTKESMSIRTVHDFYCLEEDKKNDITTQK